jgi:hypothetical protein
LIAAADGKSPFPTMPTTAAVRHIGDRNRGRQTQRANLIGRYEASHGRSGKAKPPERAVK